MLEIFRIVENQSDLYAFEATRDEEMAIQLELLIELTKPKMEFSEWDTLIATPFRYPVPISPQYQARFRPPFSQRNIFYGSCAEETMFYEHAYHFMLERLHLIAGSRKKTDMGSRTIFSTSADDQHAIRIHQLPNIHQIMDKLDYMYSHQYIEKHADQDFLIYPSCRDPKERDNVAIFNIQYLSKNVTMEKVRNFFYDYKKQFILWIKPQLKIYSSEFNLL